MRETIPYVRNVQTELQSLSDNHLFFEDALKKHPIQYLNNGIVKMRIDKKIAVASDTHFGNVYEAFQEYRRFYDDAKGDGIRQLFHCGDFFAGGFEHPRYASRLIRATPKEQADYVIDNHPKGIDIYVVKGNHDPKFLFTDDRDEKEEIDKYVMRYRKDIHFLGYYSIRIIDPYDLHIMDMVHSNGIPGKVSSVKHDNVDAWKEEIFKPNGSGGNPFKGKPDWSGPKKKKSASIIPEGLVRYIDSIPENQKPHMLLSGHYHVNMASYYNDIYVIAAGCFVKFKGYDKTRDVNAEQTDNRYFSGNGKQQKLNKEPICGFIVDMERHNGKLCSVKTQQVFNF
jgi:predicted phosphodiesterase